MSFIYPNFLWALIATIIPIIIHLFNFRIHKTVYFSNVAFLENIEQESKSRNRIRDLLILFFRILIIVSLVIAFANPVKYDTTKKLNNCQNTHCIYIDNSFSMNALNKNGSSIEVAKSRATDIISSFTPNSKCLFVTNEFSSNEQHFYISDIVKENIGKTSISSFSRTTNFVLKKIKNIILENTEGNCFPDIYLISDFQKNIFDVSKIKNDTNYNVYLIPIAPNSPDNLFIDTVWFESPFHLFLGQDSMIIKIVNQANSKMINQQIKLYLNDTLKTMTTFDIEARSSKEVKLKFINTSFGDISGRIEIEDYPVVYDNKLFFDYYISLRKKILLIETDKNIMLEEFYNNEKYFDLSTCNSSNIPISTLNSYQTIILEINENLSTGLKEKLYQFVENNGVLVILPNNNTKLSSLNNFLEKFNLPNFTVLDTHKFFINKLNIQDKIFKNAFEKIQQNTIFPYFKIHYKINSSEFFNINNLISLENDDLLLYSRELGSGMIYVFTSNLDKQNTDFMLNPISVPTFYNIPVFSSNIKIPYYIIGESDLIELKNIEPLEFLKFKNLSSDFEFFPQIRKVTPISYKLSIGNFNPEAGNYKITSGEKQIGLISLNYSRKESDLKYYTLDELNEELNKNNLDNWKIYNSKGLNLQNQIKNKDQGKKYWKIFIFLTLIFILAEILIIKTIKNK